VAAYVQGGAVSFWRSKRGVLTLSVILLLALFLVRPGANRLRARIVNSISLALGRPVEVAAVKLRLLPHPGFDLEDFVVHDDPAFGAEPMLRASEVTASLRITSLLRGRLEIARLNLTEPSLNLVRNPAGHWNLENLVERAERISVAPTSKAKTEKRPGFPYIEADRGRINFKFGAEKKPYALTEADFALWQDAENAWGVRLKARPMRTDFNLSDTGTVTVDGSWQRAATLRDTPLLFTLQWDRAQLGQVTKLAYGHDKGWRGGVKISTTLNGTPTNLAIVATASVQDFRRYDIFGGGDLRLGTQCSGRYSSLDHTLSEISCSAPVGEGAIALAGSINGPFSSRNYDLKLTAQDLPIQSLIALARHAKQGMPDDLIAAGQLHGNLELRRIANSRSEVIWEGTGETTGFELASKLNKTALMLGRIPFAVAPAITSKSRASVRILPAETHLEVGPFELALGRPTPATVRGWASHSEYNFFVQGDAQVQRLLQVARIVGIPVPQPAAEGVAKVDLQVAGAWSGFAAPKATGKAQLHSVHAEVRGLNAPLEIASANLVLTADQISAQNLTASIADSAWRGSLAFPRPCTADSCPVRFDLHADEIATDRLNQLLNPHLRKQPWYRFLSSPAAGVPYLLTVHATGKLTASRVLMGKLVANRVSTNVDLDKGRLRLSDLHADVLGGKHVGEWQANFTAKTPEYNGGGRVERIDLDQLSKSMDDDWIAGSATANYRLKMAGLNANELFASATSTLKIDVRDGLLRHLALGEEMGPTQMHRLAASLFLHDGQFEIQEGKLETSAGSYQISGTASLTRSLNLKLTREKGTGFNITGTLTEPRVSPIVSPETQAAFKP